MSILIQRFLKIDRREVEFARRGFTCSNPAIQDHLENIGRLFLQGYDVALQREDLPAVADRLDQIAPEGRGFAYEGAGMALALLDSFSFDGDAFPRFVARAGKQHIFMLHVGAGWAYARVPWKRRRIESVIRNLHPVLRWLVIDGYGFHEGYFHGKTEASSVDPAAHLSEQGSHVFYQGLGRSLWFVKGADVRRIAECIASFPSPYQGDAWSGAGLACAYAGGIAPKEIAELGRWAGMFSAALAQGAAFAAKARLLAGNPAKHTDAACLSLCGLGSAKAAALCDETFRKINFLLPCPYQHWRELIQRFFSASDFPTRGQFHESSVSSTLAATKSN